MQYEKDPVVEEIRETRRKLYARCNNDLRKYGELLATGATQRKARMRKKLKAKPQA